jgi:hypothetical protein
MELRLAEVVKDWKCAKEFVKLNRIKKYEIIIVWND